MPVTRFNDATLALYGLYQAAIATTLAGVSVYDGVQPVTGTDNDYIVVGHDGSIGSASMLSPDAVAGTFTQSNLEFGARQETGYVNCVIVCWTGDPSFTAHRQRASDLLQAAEDLALANGGLLSGQAAGIMLDGTSDARFINRLTGAGSAVLLAYRVYYSTEWD